ncbi:MAG: single-stranded-DNA-specific exonuclease RecJ [Acidobacteria bacterium]|nr:single-stranded-DNA-specific exonuclease RecJ [Acidobacteriota bacterium]
MVSKEWIVRKHDAAKVNELAGEVGVRPLIAALLIARGYDTPSRVRKFLEPSLEDMHDPHLLRGIRDAVRRIETAILRREKILIWGDYDVDGTTGTVLLRKAIDILGGTSVYHVPDRFTEGYGLNTAALDAAKADDVSLVITVDCGTTNVSEITHARDIGLDVIVTDHHLPKAGEDLPPAVAIINPNQLGCPYPEKNLAGVGVALKLAQALLDRKGFDKEVPQFLKIAAIGTVSDVMNLTGENRAIVALGLKDLAKTDSVGLKALMEVADCRSEMTSYMIGFRIGPRINAAGRMDVAKHIVELLEEQNFAKARKLAGILDSRNRERQRTQADITEQALFETESHDGKNFIVVAGEGWHKGVVGLASSRIAEKLFRPTIVFSINADGSAQGSARSIPGFHLLEALNECSDLFEKYGGHAAAAGMTAKLSDIEEIRTRLNEYAAPLVANLKPVLKIDALVQPSTLSLGLFDELSFFEPFGAGNPRPIFLTKGLTLCSEPLVMKDKHLKLRLQSREGLRFEAVWWDGVERSQGQTLSPDVGIEIAYTLEANSFQGKRRLQLVVEDLRADNFTDADDQ